MGGACRPFCEALCVQGFEEGNLKPQPGLRFKPTAVTKDSARTQRKTNI